MYLKIYAIPSTYCAHTEIHLNGNSFNKKNSFTFLINQNKKKKNKNTHTHTHTEIKQKIGRNTMTDKIFFIEFLFKLEKDIFHNNT